MSDKFARVLAVDDDVTTCKILAMRLQALGCRVTTATSGREALGLLETDEFDIMLLDMYMPDLSGSLVLEAVRKKFSQAQLPVIMLTSSDDNNSIVKALERGANDYVIKPTDFPVLRARIDTHLSLKTAIGELLQARKNLEQRVLERTQELHSSNAKLRSEIEQRLDTEQRLRASEQRFKSLYEKNPAMLFTIDHEGMILSANTFGANQLGYYPEQLTGNTILDICHRDDRVSMMRQLQSVISSADEDQVYRWESRLLGRDDQPVWVRTTARLSGNLDPISSILLVCEDISETYQLSRKLSYQASHDRLTGLYNRHEFELRLQQLLNRCDGETAVHALFYLDLDQFKIINDTCGHGAGDELLRQVGHRLKKAIRQHDCLARLGGDEFGILMEDCRPEQASEAGHILTHCLNEFVFMWSGKQFSTSASIGMVLVNQGDHSVPDLLRKADSACYMAKDTGRNRVHLYQDDDQALADLSGQMQWVPRIEQALAQSRLQLNMQPIVPLQHSGATGLHCEILLRMLDDDGKTIAPGEFLPAAERYNLIQRLDRWVLSSTMDWLHSSPDILANLAIVSINLSGQSVGNESLLDFILQHIDRHAIPAEKLCFEVTETAAIANLDNATRFIGILRKKGCRFALDDFGSGLSSFSYLKNLPVDFLKIDGVFIKDMVRNSIDCAMVKSINEIAHIMGKQTIAEFVEDEATYVTLKKMGIDYAQGYGIGIPRPLHSLILTPDLETAKFCID